MSTIAKIFAVILIGVSVVGCDALRAKICPVVDTHETSFVTMSLPQSTPLELEIYEWSVITPDNAQQKFSELKALGIDPVFFALTDKDFEKNTVNEEKIQGEMLMLRDSIDQLQKYYDDLDKRLNPKTTP